ncbi:MAG: M48 family metalloprotease [Burkholderiaceae bacterium]|nr:M48 family metalloprotease [Sulfuritalea sp.]MCF8176239.1 M48 family metalloprotease [Burkholderiaceae bacterium]MCF8183477.1 M48 family metalloprotease [Polynucleobacter sp.]
MKLHPLASALLLGFGILAAAPLSVAEGLPDLGEAAQTDFSPAMERKIGESVMLEIRRDPAWLGDPEVNSYLNRLGSRLSAQSQENRQDFEFFVLRDATLNAFALPGGFIGVHSGLILAATSESELASVLAHEISHVTQRHLARLMNKSSQGQVASILALAVAILAARSSPDLAIGAAMAGQGAAIQNQLNYSRDFEREADRLGLGLLERSDFDIRGMSSFFERLQKFGRLYENNAPGYLRTHPLTTERLADMGNRIQGRPYRQAADSLDFQLVRAKLRAQEGTPREAVVDFETRLKDRSFAGSEVAMRYGLSQAHLRGGAIPAAEREMSALRRLKAVSPMIETLAAQLRLKQGDAAGAVTILRAAQRLFPQERAIAYALVESLLEAGLPQDAIKVTEEELLAYTTDARMHELQAKTYAKLGKRLQQHRAQAEAYVLRAQIPAAVEQFELAQKAGDGNFYEQSQVDARLRELRKRLADEARQRKPN